MHYVYNILNKTSSEGNKLKAMQDCTQYDMCAFTNSPVVKDQVKP